MTDSIVIEGAQTHCSLLNSVYDLKATQMNLQRNLIRKFMLYEFQLGHNATEATKNSCREKGDDTVDYNTITRWFLNFSQVART